MSVTRRRIIFVGDHRSPSIEQRALILWLRICGIWQVHTSWSVTSECCLQYRVATSFVRIDHWRTNAHCQIISWTHPSLVSFINQIYAYAFKLGVQVLVSGVWWEQLFAKCGCWGDDDDDDDGVVVDEMDLFDFASWDEDTGVSVTADKLSRSVQRPMLSFTVLFLAGHRSRSLFFSDLVILWISSL